MLECNLMVDQLSIENVYSIKTSADNMQLLVKNYAYILYTASINCFLQQNSKSENCTGA